MWTRHLRHDNTAIAAEENFFRKIVEQIKVDDERNIPHKGPTLIIIKTAEEKQLNPR